MNAEAEPSSSRQEDVDDKYRRLSALAPSRPSVWVRRSVLAHAKQLVAERAIRIGPAAAAHVADKPMPVTTEIQSTAEDSAPAWRRRPAIFGAGAVLVAVVIALVVSQLYHDLKSPTALLTPGSPSPATAQQPIPPATETMSPTTQAASPAAQATSPTAQATSPTAPVISPTAKATSPTAQAISPTAGTTPPDAPAATLPPR
jgi:hypothetical protein